MRNTGVYRDNCFLEPLFLRSVHACTTVLKYYICIPHLVMYCVVGDSQITRHFQVMTSSCLLPLAAHVLFWAWLMEWNLCYNTCDGRWHSSILRSFHKHPVFAVSKEVKYADCWCPDVSAKWSWMVNIRHRHLGLPSTAQTLEIHQMSFLEEDCFSDMYIDVLVWEAGVSELYCVWFFAPSISLLSYTCTTNTHHPNVHVTGQLWRSVSATILSI